jgi:hypothetical protein
MKTPYFCTIAPTKYLDKYARYTKSPFHLLLAHLMHPGSEHFDQQYLDFYKSTKQPNEVYMMDCGAFELGQSYEPTRLVEIGKSVNADILVLPDYPWQHWTKTRDAAVEFIPQFKESGFKTFYVPQSETGEWNDWLAGFEWALFNDDINIIGMSILAHPIALPDIPKCYARVVAADRIRQWLNADQHRVDAFEAKHIHWLGLLSPGLEVEPLLRMGMVNTLDSSGPVQYGHCGIHYNPFGESWSSVDKRFVPEVDFGCHVNKHAGPIIEHNLNMLEGVFAKHRKMAGETQQ